MDWQSKVSIWIINLTPRQRMYNAIALHIRCRGFKSIVRGNIKTLRGGDPEMRRPAYVNMVVANLCSRTNQHQAINSHHGDCTIKILLHKSYHVAKISRCSKDITLHLLNNVRERSGTRWFLCNWWVRIPTQITPCDEPKRWQISIFICNSLSFTMMNLSIACMCTTI